MFNIAHTILITFQERPPMLSLCAQSTDSVQIPHRLSSTHTPPSDHVLIAPVRSIRGGEARCLHSKRETATTAPATLHSHRCRRGLAYHPIIACRSGAVGSDRGAVFRALEPRRIALGWGATEAPVCVVSVVHENVHVHKRHGAVQHRHVGPRLAWVVVIYDAQIQTHYIYGTRERFKSMKTV